MNAWSIIGVILSSSVLTALVTIGANWFIHRDQYKKEYYKLILQRRLNAYEVVDEFISNLNFMVLDNNELKHQVLFKQELLEDYLLKLAEIKKHGNWISAELSILLSELNQFLLNLMIQLENKSISINQIAIENRDAIAGIKFRIFECLNSDLLKLYDINSFLKNFEKEVLFPIKFEKQK